MFYGSIVALVTPMKSNLQIDYDAFDRLIEWQISEGTQGIVVLGTTGESPTITLEERKQLIVRAQQRIQKRVPLIVGTGANDTQKAIELTQQAMELGANGALLVVPYYNKPTQAGLFQHFYAIAQAAAIPQILYNVPSRTGVDLLPETVARLVEMPNIVAIKQSADSMDRFAQLLAIAGTSFRVLAGDDAAAAAFLLAGGNGLISVTANIAPRAVAALCAAALAGEKEKALAMSAELMALNQALFVETNPIPIKWLLAQVGKIEGGIRLPMTKLSDAFHERVLHAFERLSVR